MAQIMKIKYTILKVLIQNSSKVHNSNKGFTLIELMVGLIIMVLIGGFAMNAFIEASTTFSKDKKNIDSSQNLSAILEMIGNDIKQSGEQINDTRFPVVEIEPNTDVGSMSGSSKITVRRALTTAMTLCEDITNTDTNTKVTLTVADNSLLGIANCNAGTLLVGTLTATTLPTPITRPTALRDARNYRCKLDDINADYTSTITDFCNGNAQEKVLAAMSDGVGNVRIFQYTNDTEITANTKYQITIANLQTSKPLSTATYTSGTTPIYLVEERIYTLKSNGDFQLARDGGDAQTLIKGIKLFNVSARVYGDKTTKQSDAIDPASAIAGTTNVLPLIRRCDAATPYYICNFNTYRPLGAGTPPTIDDWKTLQGIKVSLQAKYDATGRGTEANANPKDIERLTAVAEFFPRNVLSK